MSFDAPTSPSCRSYCAGGRRTLHDSPRNVRTPQFQKYRRNALSDVMGLSESDFGAFFTAFVEELARLGWTDGRNVRFEQRWKTGRPAGTDADEI